MQTMSIGVSQQQATVMSRQSIQTLEVLQFDSQQLNEFIQEKVESNPFLVAEAARPARADFPARHMRGGGAAFGTRTAAAPSLEETQHAPLSLREFLLDQIGLGFPNGIHRGIAEEIAESIDPDGYLRRPTHEIARSQKTDEATVIAVLEQVQRLEPAGVAARNLAECYRIQLEETGSVSRPMTLLLDNLDLLGRGELLRLVRICELDIDGVRGMISKLRGLQPFPGLQYSTEPIIPALPDLLLSCHADDTITLELNPQLLPRVLLDREYIARLSGTKLRQDERAFVSQAYRDATWLVRSLDQRASTLLKVATAIVQRQREFFHNGVNSLKPLSQKEIALQVGVHESTVSRAIANKHIMSSQGLIALKFFFGEAIPSSDDDAGVSSEIVRHKIAAVISCETAGTVSSDDDIVAILGRDGISIARRTVAKYRSLMDIPSSSIRKRRLRLMPRTAPRAA